MGADKSAENTLNAQKFICPNCLSNPKILGFWWKKASLGVRSPCSKLTILLLISAFFNFEIQQKLDEIPGMIDAAVDETEGWFGVFGITSERIKRAAEGKILFRFEILALKFNHAEIWIKLFFEKAICYVTLFFIDSDQCPL